MNHTFLGGCGDPSADIWTECQGMDMILTEVSGILPGKEQSFLRLLGLRATHAKLAACVQAT